jgi:transcriptional regulator with XRE-family HTH domain
VNRYGDWLAELIKQNCITQRELAVKTQLDESTISLYVSNKRVPNMKNHMKICDALKVNTNFFTV